MPSNIVRITDRRAKINRACAGCGAQLPPDAPRHHRNCKKCWSLASYRRAVFAFLDASRARP